MYASCAIPEQLEVLRPVPDAQAYGSVHMVKEGDTLYSICKNYQADCQEVAEVNGIEDPRQLQLGQKIFIPDIDRSGGNQVAYTPPAISENFSIQQWKGLFIWPLSGVMTTKFGVRHGRRHDGIDIAAPEGTKIRAAADGTVLYAGDQQTGYGNLIILRHTKNMISIYAHNKTNLVKTGNLVKQGNVIALVGKTGRASGPHLHFEIREGAKARNPLFFLPKIN